MPLTFNGNTPSAVTYNGNPVSEVTYNGVTVWRNAPSYPPYLTFSSANAFDLDSLAVAGGASPSWDGTLEYSTDKSTWATWDGTTISSAADNGTHYLYLRGTGNTVISGNIAGDNALFLSGSAVSCDGDIRTLLDYADPENATMGALCFAGLFAYNPYLVKSPDLPATSLVQQCYGGMFFGCSSLEDAPLLPATTLAAGCYLNMFNGCSSLRSLPALNALNYPASCCAQMFRSCSLIKISTTQTGDYQTPYRIPMDGTGSTSGINSFGGMFTSTGGTFIYTPDINTTYYTSNTIVS